MTSPVRHLYPILLTVTLTLALAGCSTRPIAVVHDIPNFRTVASKGCIYRGGQPKTPAAWAYLHSLGVSNVVKLNLETEVSDSEATALGMKVRYFPINEWHQFLFQPDGLAVSNAVAAIQPGTFVHCMEGHDRTGLIIACKRVWQDGWTKDAAWKEARADGFDWRLRGLIRFWNGSVEAKLVKATKETQVSDALPSAASPTRPQRPELASEKIRGTGS